MSDPVADRYADNEPLFPDWAAPIYLWLSVATSVIYLGLDLTTVSMPGLALAKALGIILLGVYALLQRAPVLAVALFLSAGGDYALAMRPVQQEAGIVFFALAHLTYIGIFAVMLKRGGVNKGGLILSGALFAYGAMMWVWLSPGMGELVLPASTYLGIIVLMAIVAGLAQAPRLVLIGALLFVASDSVLAARWFQDVLVFERGWDWGGVIVWTTYYGAQLCLALGVVKANAERKAAGAAPA